MQMNRVSVTICLASFAIATAACLRSGLAGTVVTVGAQVPSGERIPVERIDHSVWDRLLKQYVDTAGMVDYASWKSSSDARAALDQYLRHLSTASFPRGSGRDARLAFWINAYNAVTVKGILREYPTSSIRDHTPRFFGYHIWKDLQLIVGDASYSLEAIEHEVLRPMGEPRIHFAIVCASMGCPRLLNEAYTAKKLDDQLRSNAKAFFADPTKFQYDVAARKIAVSPILKWFAEDFGDSQEERLQRIAPYLPDSRAQQLVRNGSVRVSYLDYDWTLNDRQK